MAKDTEKKIPSGKIIDRGMETMMKESMMPYAEYVILERALPRVEDGLKPVQRRILYTMMELSLTPDKPYRKCARIVGDCLGKYHPHGDTSVYDALVRMAQPFNMQAPLVDGHGNFGSVDGDPAAAMRYTEARMMPLATELLADIEKDTVTFHLNFDDSLKEPDTLPGAFPNLLVNGATGIAVGLATNIPPHNFGEAINAVVAAIDKPDITLQEVMQHMPCPDFPTGGYLLTDSEIQEAYETGRGKLVLRAKTHFEPQKNGKTLIVITELPYQVNKASALEKILAITQQKKTVFSGVSDIRDESDREGMRAVIEVKKDADPEKILEYLFKYSDLQTTFGVNMVAIANGRPMQMGVLDIIRHYIEYRREVVIRRTRYDLDNAKRREHILEGLMIAIRNIDEVIALIRASKSPKEARQGLMEKFALSEAQAQAILDLRLQRLTNMELMAIRNEYEQVQKLIKELESILASETKLRAVIKKELLALRDKYSTSRRTKLMNASSKIDAFEEQQEEVFECTLWFLDQNRVRRTTKGAQVQETVLFKFDTATNKKFRLFTNKGSAILLSVADVPETKPAAKPTNLSSLIEFEQDERIVSIFGEDQLEGDLLFYTKQGLVKRTGAEEYKSKSKRIGAISLKDDDELLCVGKEEGDTILMVSKKGMAIRFESSSVPKTGRVSAGVKAFKLEKHDEVLFAKSLHDEGELLLVTDRGYAKRCFIFDYDIQNRNGKGQKTFEFKKNGSNGMEIAGALYVTDPVDILVVQFHGSVSNFNSEHVPIQSKNSPGQLLVMAMLDDVVTSVLPKI